MGAKIGRRWRYRVGVVPLKKQASNPLETWLVVEEGDGNVSRG